MVRRGPQRREQKLFAGGFLAATPGFNSDKHGIDFIQNFSIIKAESPTPVRRVVQIEDAHIQRPLISPTSPSPGLKRSLSHTVLPLQFKSVKDKRFPARSQHP